MVVVVSTSGTHVRIADLQVVPHTHHCSNRAHPNIKEVAQALMSSAFFKTSTYPLLAAQACNLLQ
jgi:hypothetical protein